MSKQSEAKAAQGYIDKAIPKTCGNCANFVYEMALPDWMRVQNQGEPGKWGDVHKQEQNKRCGLGGFAVKKMGTCNKWEAKP